MRRWVRRSVLVSLVAIALVVLPAITFSQDSQVRTTLCDNQPPSVQVILPVAGSTVNANSVVVQGTADRTSYIQIFKNSELAGTANIGYSGDFSIPLTLNEGLNVFEIKATLTCNTTEQTQQLAVTYDPFSTPPDASSGESGSNGGPSGNGVQQNSIPGEEPASFLERVRENLGLSGNQEQSKDYDSSFVKPVINWIALVILFTALSAAIFPLFFSTLLSNWFGWQIREPSARSRRILRIFCVITVILLGFLLQL